MTSEERYRLMVDMREKGMTYQSIARYFSVTRQAVHDRLRKGPPKGRGHNRFPRHMIIFWDGIPKTLLTRY